MHFLLFYDYVPDYLVRRKQYRNEHLSLAWQAQEQGKLILAGVMEEPVDSAVLLFEVDSAAEVKAFAETDPYVKNGLVKSFRIRPWNTVVGEGAVHPVRPD
jgi:uncharacterized protein YciI